MFLSKDCPLILSHLFYYDIQACNYNLLKYSNIDNIKKIDYEDKIKRNIQIGILQKHDEYIKIGLNLGVNDLISNILKTNNLKTEDIILRASDGFITKKHIQYTEGSKLILKTKIAKLIIDVTRRKYLLIDQGGQIEIKGVQSKPNDITFLNFFNKVNFTSYNKLLSSIEDFRQNFLSSKNINYFTHTINENEVTLPIKSDIGSIRLKKIDLDVIDINQIDKKKIWDEIVWPFCQSILVSYIYEQRSRFRK
jgi:hypothetical protein